MRKINRYFLNSQADCYTISTGCFCLSMCCIKNNSQTFAMVCYSQAIEVNGMVYTSGVIPVIPATGEIVEGGVEAQADQAFKNLCNLVEASGSKIENIVKTTVFIKEMNDFGKINEIYKNYFKEPFPARSCVEVARLPKDVLLEVEAIAWK